MTLPPPIVEIEVTDAIELTELFGPWVNLVLVDETDGLEPCVGVAGEDTAVEAPNKRRVEEKSRDGRRLDEEYCTTLRGVPSR